MVDWHDPPVVASTAVLFAQMAVFLLGFYGWHFVLTLHIEWRLLTGRLPFRWPCIPYLLGRYTLLCSLLSIAISSRLPMKMHCQGAFESFSAIGCFAVVFSSTNLSIRTLVIWKHCLLVQLFLVALVVGHCCIAVVTGLTSVRAYWETSMSVCRVVHTGRAKLASFYLYTVLQDFIILVLTISGLYKTCKRSELFSIVCVQGVWYFVLTLVVNIPTVIFVWLNLNPIMNVFFSLPAVTISVLASSRAVLSLLQREECDDMSSSSSVTDTRRVARPARTLRSLWGPKSEPDQFTTHIALTPSIIEADSSGIFSDTDAQSAY
ncbi:hypothetical protein AcV5_008166 [Taiwanofungus camphoratus]|nr:hypothetical protein AcV5_008166 [Antrodia cinnamomea]